MIVNVVNDNKKNVKFVECDHCSTRAVKGSIDPGDAADAARAEGFITIPGARPSSPKSWLCSGCSMKPVESNGAECAPSRYEKR